MVRSMRDDTPSDTARLVARSIVLAAEDERLRTLVAEGEAETLRRILGESGGWFGWARRRDWARGLFFNAMDLMVPGIVPHYLARKRRIETAVREALAGGAARVVVLGAGFDALAWRLHGDFPEVAFVELDHPATQRVKRRALGEAVNFTFGQVDLVVDSLATHLKPAAGVSTVFVAEGLTMYLREERVAALLRDLASLAGPAGRVIFTFMEEDDAGSIGFRGQNPLVAGWLKLRSEPFLWGIRRDRLPDFLASCGLGNPEVVDDAALRAEVLAPLGLREIRLARGECLCLCSPIANDRDPVQ
jgi:methyltransferase (TIGR00027 family)